MLFGACISSGGNLTNGEYIRVWQKKDEFNKTTFWNNIDDLNSFIEGHRFNGDTYFNLATTTGDGGTDKDLKYRYFLAWDFDKKTKDIDAKKIMFKFKELGLWYHALIDSGHGYHVYMLIDKTDDLEKVDKVTKAIGGKLVPILLLC